MRSRLLYICALIVCATSAGAQIGTVRFAQSLQSPTYLTAAPGDTGRVFVVERAGDIEILDTGTGVPRATPFLSVPGVNFNEGFLGLAFHPSYATNGYFYVYYGAGSVARLVRYRRSTSNPDRADSTSALTIASVSGIVGDHIGGWIGFGPDGYLYWQIGDGGYGGYYDASNTAQSITGELLGNVLRIDVDRDDFPGDANRNYGIPSDNPFVGVAGQDEIWAYGLRNPYRGSFDRWNGDYTIADVGENDREELNFQRAGTPGGQNYGWRGSARARLRPPAAASADRSRRRPWIRSTSTRMARARTRARRSSAATCTAVRFRRCAASTSSATTSTRGSGRWASTGTRARSARSTTGRTRSFPIPGQSTRWSASARTPPGTLPRRSGR